MLISKVCLQVLLGHQPVLELGDSVELLPSVGAESWNKEDSLEPLSLFSFRVPSGPRGPKLEPRPCRPRSTPPSPQKPWQPSGCCRRRHRLPLQA